LIQGQNPLRSLDPQSVVLRQYIPQQIDLVAPSQIVKIQEKVVPSQIINVPDDSPVQCFSHSNASSTSTQVINYIYKFCVHTYMVVMYVYLL
jgi:hypothetical protein